ncbi:hypothetical protein Taro_032779, partial [Colocasia esculenta]|nr:hypothetical protein [Colocasia esculenta]
MWFQCTRVSSVGRICQPICTTGSLSGITAEEGDAIMNASALLDVIPRTASVTRGTGFRLASDRGDTFKGFKRGVCLGRDFDQSVKSFVSAIQSRGCSVRRRGGCCGVPDGGFFRRSRLPAVRAAREPREDDARSVGVPSARRFWRLPAGLNVAFALDAILISVIKASFQLDRAEEVLFGAGEKLLWLLRQISGGFDIVNARVVQEPREDDARSVGMPSVRRL